MSTDYLLHISWFDTPDVKFLESVYFTFLSEKDSVDCLESGKGLEVDWMNHLSKIFDTSTPS